MSHNFARRDFLKAGAAVAAGHVLSANALAASPNGKLRTAHLEHLRCPALIVQGDRDPFGTRAEVETYALSSAIAFVWAGDGNHDLAPSRGSPFTRAGNLAMAADAVTAFSHDLT